MSKSQDGSSGGGAAAATDVGGWSSSPKLDNWRHISYQDRILDALANLFCVFTDCAAVVQYKGTLYLSFNAQVFSKDLARVNHEIKAITTCIHTGSIEQLLSLHLLLNSNFMEFVKNQIRHEAPGPLKDSLSQLKAIYTSLKPKLQSSAQSDCFNPDDYLAVHNAYRDVLLQLLHQQKAKDVVEQLLRPLQDVVKVYHCTNGEDFAFQDVKILDNKDGAHAEYNITMHFPLTKYLESSYIGISKLCCGFCHEYLSAMGYHHRGTHGWCDQKWKLLSPQDREFKEQLYKKYHAHPANPPEQRSDLSDDEFEGDMALPMSTTPSPIIGWSLAYLKTALGLPVYSVYDDHNTRGILGVDGEYTLLSLDYCASL